MVGELSKTYNGVDGDDVELRSIGEEQNSGELFASALYMSRNVVEVFTCKDELGVIVEETKDGLLSSVGDTGTEAERRVRAICLRRLFCLSFWVGVHIPSPNRRLSAIDPLGKEDRRGGFCC